jgi:hypothetical protein
MMLIVTPTGEVRCLYGEAIDLSTLGSLNVQRASNLEPDASGRWWADLSPVAGPILGPFIFRSAALAAEQAWLEQNRLLQAGG